MHAVQSTLMQYRLNRTRIAVSAHPSRVLLHFGGSLNRHCITAWLTCVWLLYCTASGASTLPVPGYPPDGGRVVAMVSATRCLLCKRAAAVHVLRAANNNKYAECRGCRTRACLCRVSRQPRNAARAWPFRTDAVGTRNTALRGDVRSVLLQSMYVKVKRQKTTIFLLVEPADTVASIKQKLEELVQQVRAGRGRPWQQYHGRLPGGCLSASLRRRLGMAAHADIYWMLTTAPWVVIVLRGDEAFRCFVFVKRNRWRPSAAVRCRRGDSGHGHVSTDTCHVTERPDANPCENHKSREADNLRLVIAAAEPAAAVQG